MARSDEAEWWFNAVYEAVQEIPRGQVTSYGHIARLLGRRKSKGNSFDDATNNDFLQLQPNALGQLESAEIRNWWTCSNVSSRSQVGICLKHLPSYSAETDHYFHSDNVPWQRVVNSKGIISPRFVFLFQGLQGGHSGGFLTEENARGPGGTARQAAALRREGVTVETGHMGELSVDLGAFGWFPNVLPSEEAEEGANDESEDSEGKIP